MPCPMSEGTVEAGAGARGLRGSQSGYQSSRDAAWRTCGGGVIAEGVGLDWLRLVPRRLLVLSDDEERECKGELLWDSEPEGVSTTS